MSALDSPRDFSVVQTLQWSQKGFPPQCCFLTHYRPLRGAVCFLSQLSIRLLVLATGKDRESLQSWTDSPRIKFLLETHGRKEQIESLKKMEIDGAFALEISLCNSCLLCHPHLNQRPWSASHAHSCQDLACPCLPSQHVPWMVHGPMSVVGGVFPSPVFPESDARKVSREIFCFPNQFLICFEADKD